MDRVRLSRLPGGRVLVVDGDRSHELATDDLPAHVAERERRGTPPPRWVWDDTARWYPRLLAAGVRVARCHDLRLGRRLLRLAPDADQAALTGEQAERWDRLGPARPDDEALFSADDTTEPLRADLEDARQQAAVAASSAPGPLALLLAAESAGALAAAEMTYVGLPWRAEVHERLLVELLGPRPPRGARPARLEAVAAEVRAALGSPGLNPDSQPELLAALRRAGVEVTSTRASALRAVEHPAVEAVLRYRQLAHLFQTNGWAWVDQWVRDGRFRPSYQPAGSATGRWSSNGGGALSIPAQVRPAVVADDGWLLVVADVAQLEPRVLAAMSRDRALARSASGADLYQGMVDQGAVGTRAEAKLALIGAMYGATSGESGRLLGGLARRYPAAFGLVEEAARAGERGEQVRTLLGRGSPHLVGGHGPEGEQEADWSEGTAGPLVGLDDGDRGDRDGRDGAERRRRAAHGRFTRNFVVQGTGAEWASCWVADLRNRLWRLGGDGGDGGDPAARPHLAFFLHDEVVVHTPAGLAGAVAEQTVAAAATAARLLFGDLAVDFPLTVATVRSYAEAGKPGTTEPGTTEPGST